jgi:D-glycero-alpha-D-manno-heptose-7-phosphate kinase
MRITSEAPCRVDLAGGTLDIWPLYLFHDSGVTVNFAVNIYTGCTLQPRADSKIVIRSRDLNCEETYDSLDALRAAKKHKLPLVAHILRFFRPEGGINIETYSESPAGAGISGSSAMIIATTSALNKYCGTGYSIEKLREISQNIEAQIIRVSTGCQDYYPAMYGGVNAIELRVDGLARHAIPVDHEELNSRFVLAYTGEPRNSGINNWEVTKAHIGGDKKVHRNFATIAAIANGMRAALERADWNDAERLLREEWTNRKRNAPGITTPLIDRMVQVTKRAGAKAAKVCGAGGGGCVLFLVEPGSGDRVAAAIEREGARVLPAKVSKRGVRVAAEKPLAHGAGR